MKIVNKDYIRIKNKAQATWIVQMVIGLFVIGMAAFLYFLMYGRYFDVHAIVESNEAKRHVINMGHVLLSSHRLVYEESFDDGSKRFYRGVFDADKLDEELVNEEGFLAGLLGTRGGELSREVSYPRTATRIVVDDIQNGNKWAVSFGSPGLENVAGLINCFNIRLDQNFWAVPLVRHFTPWKDWDAEECYATYTSKIGVFDQKFPVLIYDEGEMHAGRLYLRVMEL
jgi:hypothetical protein